MDGRRARIVLGVGNDAGPSEIRRAFRARALVRHPDHGGDRNEFAELVEALDALDGPTLGSGRGTAPVAARLPLAPPVVRPRFDAYDSPQRPAPRREFADILRATTARMA